jgi:FKBP-type peptidyl-prolyl cis-trans isomerase SlyD
MHSPNIKVDQAVKIADKSVVNFHYRLSDDSSEELETSHGGDPSVYLHGAGNIIPGLEQAMTDHESGDEFNVALAPQDAYGLRNTEKVQRVPVKHLVFKGKLKAGMAVQLNTSDGLMPVTVAKAGRHTADIDTNHPLAGKALSFAIRIVDVREATAEELAHGHAHGPGGHQH